MSLNLMVESVGTVTDSLTGKEADGLTVTMNGKRRSFTWKSFKQVLSMELAEVKEPAKFPTDASTPPGLTRTVQQSPANGPVVATPAK